MWANLWKYEVMWFCSSPFGIAHHKDKSSRVLISGGGLFINPLMGVVVRCISLLRLCFAVFEFNSWYHNTCFPVFFCKIWKAASWGFDCQYACLRSIIAICGSSKFTLIRLQSWRIWLEKEVKRCIVTKWKYDSSTRCSAISHSSCALSTTAQELSAATERLF